MGCIILLLVPSTPNFMQVNFKIRSFQKKKLQDSCTNSELIFMTYYVFPNKWLNLLSSRTIYHCPRTIKVVMPKLTFTT